MARVAVVTDSTACLPSEEIERYGIEVVPVNLVHDGRVYRDGVDISPEEFYQLLEKAKKVPTTSPASPGDYLRVFQRLGEKADAILCITVVARLSAMYDSARAAMEAARETMPHTLIQVLDSGTAAMAQGFIVLAATRAAALGKDLQGVVAAAQRVKSRVDLVAVLDTLTYLARGGRVPNVAAWASSLLQVKPILSIKDGEVRLAERARTKKKAVSRLLEIMKDRVAGQRPLRAAVFHAHAQEEALSLRDQVVQAFQPEELYVTQFTPVMGVHTGPGLVGLAFYTGE